MTCPGCMMSSPGAAVPEPQFETKPAFVPRMIDETRHAAE